MEAPDATTEPTAMPSEANKRRQRNPRGKGSRLREEIIEAAIQVLAGSVAGEPFSLRSVAKEAMVAPPSVYIHFTDKTVLLMAVIEQLFSEVAEMRNAAEAEVLRAGGGAWERLLARSFAYVRFGLERPGHYRVLYEGRAILLLDDPRTAAFGLPMLTTTIELIREVQQSAARETADDPERLALLLWAGLHGVVSLRINKPTIDWPGTYELAEQMTRALILPGALPITHPGPS